MHALALPAGHYRQAQQESPCQLAQRVQQACAHPVSRGAAHPALPHKLWQLRNHCHLAPGVVVAGVSLRVSHVGYGLVVLNLRLGVMLVWYRVSQAECAPGCGAAQRLQERRASAREGPPHLLPACVNQSQLHQATSYSLSTVLDKCTALQSLQNAGSSRWCCAGIAVPLPLLVSFPATPDRALSSSSIYTSQDSRRCAHGEPHRQADGSG